MDLDMKVTGEEVAVMVCTEAEVEVVVMVAALIGFLTRTRRLQRRREEEIDINFLLFGLLFSN